MLLSNIRRSELTGEDSRIFTGWYAPVMVMENGKRVVPRMRYQCRPVGKPAFDVKFPGTYNARRDSLGSYWKDLFGYSHGIMIASALRPLKYPECWMQGINTVAMFDQYALETRYPAVP